MGKKAKGGKAKGKKDKGPVVLSPEEQELANMRTEAVVLFRQAQKEVKEYNELQQQVEKILYFWIVEKKVLDDKKAELRNKEREMQDLEEKQDVEVKIYKQRVKHLLADQEQKITELKTEAEIALDLSRIDHQIEEHKVVENITALKHIQHEQETSHDALVASIKQEMNTRMTILRQDFERQAFELSKQYKKLFRDTRERLEKDRKIEIEAIEKKKDTHTKQLLKNHEKAFNDIKNYYNDITHHNFDLIKSLKEEVGEMKKKEQMDEKLMADIAAENMKMSEPLTKARHDVESLRGALGKYQVEKDELKNVKNRLRSVQEKHKSVKWENEVLKQRLQVIERDRNELKRKFSSCLLEMKVRNSFRSILYHKRIEALSGVSNEKEASIAEIISKVNLDPSILGKVKVKTEDIVETKNMTIRELQAQLEKVQDLYKNMTNSMENKMSEFGIPVEELGFKIQRNIKPSATAF